MILHLALVIVPCAVAEPRFPWSDGCTDEFFLCLCIPMPAGFGSSLTHLTKPLEFLPSTVGLVYEHVTDRELCARSVW